MEELHQIWRMLPLDLIIVVIEQTDHPRTIRHLVEVTKVNRELCFVALLRHYQKVCIRQLNLIPSPDDPTVVSFASPRAPHRS